MEVQKSGYYNLVSWKTQNMSIWCPFWKEDVRSRCYPPAGQIKVGTGGNKLAASHRVDNIPEWKFKYELKKIVICPGHRQKFTCLRDQSGPHQHPFRQGEKRN